MQDKEIKLKTCRCVEQVDVTHLCSLLEGDVLKGNRADGPSPLFCVSCRLEYKKPAKKKQFFDSFSFKKKKSRSGDVLNEKVEDPFLCVSCAIWLCFEHAKEHANQLNGNFQNCPLQHKLFLSTPSNVDTQSVPSTLGLADSALPSCSSYDESSTMKGPLTSIENANGINCTSQPNKFVMKVWCSSCTKMSDIVKSTASLTHSIAYDRGLYSSTENELAALMYHFLYGGSSWKEEFLHSKRRLVRSRSRSRPRSGSRGRAALAPQSGPIAGHISSVSTSSHPNANYSWEEVERMVKGHVAGVENVRNTCYFNSVLQCVLQCRHFTTPILQYRHSSAAAPLTQSLQAMMRHLRERTTKDFGRNTVYSYARRVFHQLCQISSIYSDAEQQDSQELYLTLVNGVDDEFEKHLTKEEKKRGSHLSFKGALSTEVECEMCKKCFSRSEMFMALSIPVESSIESGFEKLFSPMHLTGKDQYACENCFLTLSKDSQAKHNASVNAENEKKAKAKKKNGKEEKKSLNCIYSNAEVRTSISSLGGSLALHLLRFHRDSRGLQKNSKAVEFGLELNLCDYVSQELKRNCMRAHRIAELQKQYSQVPREKLIMFLDKSEGNLSKAWQMVSEFVKNEQIHSTGEWSQKSLQEINGDHYFFDNDINSNSSNNSDNDDCNQRENVSFGATNAETKHSEEAPLSLNRHLVGIVTHRGSLYGGHYVAYVRNMEMPDTWFRCDDEDVGIVNVSTVLACKTEVYMLFYE